MVFEKKNNKKKIANLVFVVGKHIFCVLFKQQAPCQNQGHPEELLLSPGFSGFC